ncbi:MAG: hypothetical protein FWF81_05185 [Defluviitaleaceae bacterium]|nr:hypothetical protein [Defluviitaleaceae bacterium]
MNYDIDSIIMLSDSDVDRLISGLDYNQLQQLIKLCNERGSLATGNRGGSLNERQEQFREHIRYRCRTVGYKLEDARDNIVRNQRASRVASLDVISAQEINRVRESLAKYRNCISCDGHYGIMGLKTNGSVIITSSSKYASAATSTWRKIVAVASGPNRLYVGLKSNGEVVACSEFYESSKIAKEKELLDIYDWKNVIAIDASSTNIVGLRSDGTVLATSNLHEYKEHGNYNPVDDVTEWRAIKSVVAGYCHLWGLKADGTVIGTSYRGINNTSDAKYWRDIIAIASDGSEIVGLKPDGTVVAAGSGVGSKLPRKLDVNYWRDIVAIDMGSHFTVGLRADGSVMVSGDFTKVRDGARDEKKIEQWRNVVAIATTGSIIVALMADGTVDNTYGALTNNQNFGTVSQQQMLALEQKDNLSRKKGVCPFCNEKFGFLRKKCKICDNLESLKRGY